MSLAQLIQDYWRTALHERATRQFHEDRTKAKERGLGQADPSSYLSSEAATPLLAGLAPQAGRSGPARGSLAR